MNKYLSFAACVAISLTVTACSSNNSDNESVSVNEDTSPDTHSVKSSISFSGVVAPSTDTEKRSILSEQNVVLDGKTTAIKYNTILRSGDSVGGGTFGLLYDIDGNPISDESGEVISNSNDFSSLLPVGDKLFMVSHFETRPAAMYLSELEQDADGKLTAISTKNIDFSEFNGLWVPCAGSVTPWGTHLGSEEYPPDASKVDSLGSIDPYYDAMGDYVGGDLTKLNPYDYGYVPEITVKEDGSYTAVKHYTLGRYAHELAYVMPDNKTVYASDDGTNRAFFKFVADTKGDLSSGELFAAKWTQTSASNGGTASISWVSLGHANDAEIKTALDKKPVFGDIFTTAQRDENNTCPSGFTASNYDGGNECLQINEGMEVVASRLETGRYAGMMGATTEFNKMEGITYNANKHEGYMSISRVEKGMEDYKKYGSAQDSYDEGGTNDIKLDYNKCGTVFKLNLDDDSYNVTGMEALISGVPMEADESGNTCTLDGISMPDNLTYVTETNTLIIGEDTGYHQNDVIWNYNLDTNALTRILTTPYGSETTSPYFYNDINGFSYLMAVVQHPFGESDQDKSLEDSDKFGYTGYVGPMPAIKE